MKYVLLDLFADFSEADSVRANQLEVLSGDVVVVLLHFLECGLVSLHQVVDVLVLAFLDLVDFNLHPKVKLTPQFAQLLVVIVDQLFAQGIECVALGGQLLLAFLLADVNLVVRLLLGLMVVVLFLLLHLHHLEFALSVLLLLLEHDGVSVGLDLLLTVLVVVLKVANLLHEDFELSAVTFLLGLHVSVEVLDTSLQFTDLSPRVVVEIVDHVLLHLKQVTIEFCVNELFAICRTQLLERLTVQLMQFIWRVLIFGGLSLLAFFALLSTFLASHIQIFV